MKKLTVILGIIATLACIVRLGAAEVEGSLFKAGEVGISLGADVASADLENGRLGYSGTLRYYPLLNWGLGFNATSQRLDNDYRIAPLLLWRLPVNRAALIAEAGPEYDIGGEDWSLRVSVGPAFRITENLELSVSVGARKFFGSGRQSQSIESVTTAQLSWYFGGK